MEKYLNIVVGNLYKKASTHWQWCRDFFNITVFKYLVTWFAIVPVASKILSKLPKEIKFTNDYILTLELPFKWECLWLSSLFFMMAYFLYLIFCPSFVKKYFSLKNYLEYEHSPRWLTWEAKDLLAEKSVIPKFIKRMESKGYLKQSKREVTNPQVEAGDNQSTLYFSHDKKNYEFSMPILDKEGNEDDVKTKIAVREIFWEIFGRFSSSKPFIRSMIRVLLVIALILFSITLIQSVFNALSYLLK
jgi:hypothetical protein